MTKNGMSVVDASALFEEISKAVGSESVAEINRKWWKVGINAEQKLHDLWYDWFCPDSQLTRRGISLLKRLYVISKSKRFNPETCYVFFKNNCPVSGPTYDDFRIVDDESRDVFYTVNSDAVWGIDNNFEEPLSKGNVSSLKKYFLV